MARQLHRILPRIRMGRGKINGNPIVDDLALPQNLSVYGAARVFLCQHLAAFSVSKHACTHGERLRTADADNRNTADPARRGNRRNHIVFRREFLCGKKPVLFRFAHALLLSRKAKRKNAEKRVFCFPAFFDRFRGCTQPSFA